MEPRCEAGPTNPASTTMLEYSHCMSDGEITAADRCTLCKLLCKITRHNEGNEGDAALSRRENSSSGSQRSDLTSARVSKAERLPKRDKGPQKLKGFTKKKYNGMAADKVRKSGASYENIYHSANVWLQRLLELICVFLRGARGSAGWGILHSSGLSELLCLFTIYWSQQQKNG